MTSTRKQHVYIYELFDQCAIFPINNANLTLLLCQSFNLAPPSNYVIFKDRDLKFCDNIDLKFSIKVNSGIETFFPFISFVNVLLEIHKQIVKIV